MLIDEQSQANKNQLSKTKISEPENYFTFFIIGPSVTTAYNPNKLKFTKINQDVTINGKQPNEDNLMLSCLFLLTKGL
ncbi:hypothetical protein LRA02_11040 [Lentilactobacillus rapi]|uniref:Uncharacterized protein n=1 Tax=Lentilactobacillus rapi TaxID=481723 RepID=A0A512PM15_9LACO|nr:hypothetical protein LRA02_11040 [Lentilactobacillus rapi]